jgi:peptidoglycan/LPS O-acetylase OafA/YrhL
MLRRPASVTVAAVVQAAEAAGVLAASILAGIDTGAGKSYHADSGIALTLIGVATAAALAGVAAGLARTRRWSRTPAILTQLFVGIVGIYLVQGHRFDWGVPGIALAAVGLAALLLRPSLRALAGDPAASGTGQPDGPRPGGS